MPQFYNVFLVVPFIPIGNGPKTLNIYYSNQNKFLTFSNNENYFLNFWTEKRGGPNAGRMLTGWMTGCSSYAKCST